MLQLDHAMSTVPRVVGGMAVGMLSMVATPYIQYTGDLTQ